MEIPLDCWDGQFLALSRRISGQRMRCERAIHGPFTMPNRGPLRPITVRGNKEDRAGSMAVCVKRVGGGGVDLLPDMELRIENA